MTTITVEINLTKIKPAMVPTVTMITMKRWEHMQITINKINIMIMPMLATFIVIVLMIMIVMMMVFEE